MPDNLDSFNTFKTDGFIQIPYPNDLREAVINTIESWKRFCELPVDSKKGLPYSNQNSGVGYELKDGIGNKADRKENFDITITGKSWLEQNIVQINDPIALEFIQNATALIELVKPIIINFAKQLEEEFHLEGFRKEVEESVGSFFIRFIHYSGDREIGDETATAHVDQSGFTLHLFENAPGLQCLTYDNKWINMPVSDGETVIIPSMQLQLRSEGDLTALCHRVIATPETSENGRYSSVCFVQLSKTPKYDKEKNGRLQEKLPGFNYDMDPEEFEKYFKTT